jgi:AcrR family transcriptional regulator
MSKTITKEESILNAAAELFLAQGFKDVSITNIVDKAGCSRETIYRYFNNKEDIFVNIIKQLIEDYLATMELAISLKSENLREGLIEWSLALLLSIGDEKYIRFRRLVISEMNSRPEHGKLYFEMTYQKGTNAVAKYFKVFQSKGQLKPMDTDHLAEYFVGMILYKPLHERLLGLSKQQGKKELLSYVHRVVDDFIEGYGVSNFSG